MRKIGTADMMPGMLPALQSKPMHLVNVEAKHPLTALAETAPDLAADVMGKMLDVRREELGFQKYTAKLDLLRGVSDAHTGMLCSWLANRDSAEKHAEVSTSMAAREGLFSFGRTLSFHVRTSFHIW